MDSLDYAQAYRDGNLLKYGKGAESFQTVIRAIVTRYTADGVYNIFRGRRRRYRNTLLTK